MRRGGGSRRLASAALFPPHCVGSVVEKAQSPALQLEAAVPG